MTEPTSTSQPAPLPPGATRSGGINASGAVWEQRFPTFVGGSPSASVARPVVSGVDTRVFSGGSGPPVTYPLRRPASKGGKKPQQQPGRSLTPNEALAAAKQREQLHLQFTAESIVPGNPGAARAATATATSPSRRPQTLSPERRAAGAVPTIDVSAAANIQASRAMGSTTVAPSTSIGDLDKTRSATGASASTDAGGYDRLTGSIERLQAKLSHLPLHQRWETISVWLDRFVFDAAAARLASDAVTLHREVSKQTADRGEVNGLRTAIAFMLLEQLLHIMGHTYPKLLPLAETVRDDVLRSVYVSPDTELDLRRSFFVMDDPTDPEEQRQLIDRFYKKTYYQYLREMGSKLSRKTFVFESTERTKDKQMRILNRVVTYWQRYTVERMFKGWRGYIRGRREKRKMADEIARVRKQLDDATERVGSVASEKELALERAIQLNESANTELQRVQDRCSRLEWRNDELEAAAREMNKRFEEDARVKKLVQEIAHLRKANAKLLAAAGGDAHEASVESAGGAPEEATEMSFVISDATDIAEVQKLRGELAAAKARIAQLEQQQQAP